MKSKKKPRIRKDSKGEYILQQYFVGGRQKFQRIYVIDGMPVEEFYRRNADPVTLLQDGEYWALDESGY